jgi:predicted RNA-binding Zn ribbon-like protein
LRAHAEVTNPAQLCDWLVAYGLLSEGTPVTAGDLRRFQELREAIRSLLRANSHTQVNAEQISTLNHLASNSPLKVHFHGNAQVALVPDIGGVDGALARILGIVFSAMRDHSWSRLKACRNERCQKAFYDTSKTTRERGAQ